ncbi:MAG TPA: hypothetical protein VND41_00760 [Nitrososphaerales archaeon]|nr:hypothetical protein [Nitrososphaerales archaeon]
MEKELGELLAKKTSFKPVEKMEGSRVSKAYVDYVSSLGLTETGKSVAECKRHLIEQHCLGQSAHSSWSLLLCREDKACVNEDVIENAWEMNDMELYLHLLFEHAGVKRHVWYVDFTVASDMRRKIPRDNLSSFAKLSYETMKEYFSWKLKYEADFGMDVAPQFWSSDSPGAGYRPHLHTIIPRVFFDRKRLRVIDIRMNQLGSVADLEKLKQLWRAKVESAYWRSRAKVKGKYEEFSVKVKWRNEDWKPRYYRRSMRHRLKYMYRGIVFDVEKHIAKKAMSQEPMGWQNWNNEFMRWALTASHKRHIGYGLMSSPSRSRRSVFMRTIGFDYGTRQERKKAMRKECPEPDGEGVCGCYIHRWYGDKVMPLEKAQGLGLRAVVRRFDEEALTDVQRKYQRDYAKSNR